MPSLMEKEAHIDVRELRFAEVPRDAVDGNGRVQLAQSVQACLSTITPDVCFAVVEVGAEVAEVHILTIVQHDALDAGQNDVFRYSKAAGFS